MKLERDMHEDLLVEPLSVEEVEALLRKLREADSNDSRIGWEALQMDLDPHKLPQS